MFELKPLTREAIPKALEKAERYRLLNEPVEAESICLDVLSVDPSDQRALVTLLLALTDQFDEEIPDAVQKAREVLPRLAGPYERAYYAGLLAERRAKARLKHGGPGAGSVAYELLTEAMEHFATAELLRPPGNDDALLRWNACARLFARHPEIAPAPQEVGESQLE
jgi:hypothetical protein